MKVGGKSDDCGRFTDEDFEGLEDFLDDLHSHYGDQLTCEDCVDCGKCILQRYYGALLCQYIEVEELQTTLDRELEAFKKGPWYLRFKEEVLKIQAKATTKEQKDWCEEMLKE